MPFLCSLPTQKNPYLYGIKNIFPEWSMSGLKRRAINLIYIYIIYLIYTFFYLYLEPVNALLFWWLKPPKQSFPIKTRVIKRFQVYTKLLNHTYIYIYILDSIFDIYH